MKLSSKNIIFDLGQVIFDYHPILVNELIKNDPQQAFQLIADGYDILRKCHAQKNDHGERLHRLFVLSNFGIPAYTILNQFYPTVFALFDGIIISGNIKLQKPDLRMYEHFLKTHQLDPATCIFIDDKLSNVVAAQQAGMQGIVCADYTYVTNELRALGVF
jgi:FMN phosphatase YigB (HAD superfamily)